MKDIAQSKAHLCLRGIKFQYTFLRHGGRCLRKSEQHERQGEEISRRGLNLVHGYGVMDIGVLELESLTGVGEQPPTQPENISETESPRRKGPGMSGQEPLQDVGLLGERVECPPPEPGAILQSEHYPGHHLWRAIDSPVRHLVPDKVIAGQRLGQGACLLEGQPQSLSGERVHRAGRITHQSERFPTNLADNAQSGNRPRSLVTAGRPANLRVISGNWLRASLSRSCGEREVTTRHISSGLTGVTTIWQ